MLGGVITNTSLVVQHDKTLISGCRFENVLLLFPSHLKDVVVTNCEFKDSRVQVDSSDVLFGNNVFENTSLTFPTSGVVSWRTCTPSLKDQIEELPDPDVPAIRKGLREIQDETSRLLDR